MATTVQSFSKTGTKSETAVKLAKEVFGFEGNHELVNQAYQVYLANGRVAGATTLTRGDVRGGGKKPWKQKGTGRARAGSSRIPHWRGGGVAFGPTGEQNFTMGMSVKAKRQALREALSMKATAESIVVLDTFDCPEGKVKPTIELFSKMKLEGKILLAVSVKDSLVDRATRNVAGLKTIEVKYLNVYDVMNADVIVVTTKSLEVIKEWLGDAK